MQRYHADFEKACRDIETAETSGSGRLLALINRYRSALDGGKSLCLCVSFSTSQESLSPDVITQISRFRAMLISWLKVTLEVGKSDGTIAGVGDPGQE
ncbi:MAG: TetR/AcrR family transcriptional regulator, partial [Rhodobacterales bacterium]